MRKISERLDSFEGFVFFSSLSGSMGTFCLDRINVEFGSKTLSTYLSNCPENNSPRSIASPIEIYNFTFHVENLLSGNSLAVILTNNQLYNYCL